MNEDMQMDYGCWFKSNTQHLSRPDLGRCCRAGGNRKHLVGAWFEDIDRTSQQVLLNSTPDVLTIAAPPIVTMPGYSQHSRKNTAGAGLAAYAIARE